MKRYYLDPENDQLIVADDETGQTKILPRLRNIRVFVEGEARVSEGGEGLSESAKPARGKLRTQVSERKGGKLCKKCGKPGHMAKTCDRV